MVIRSSEVGPIGSELVREDASFADLVVEFVEGLGDRLTSMDDALREANFDALRVAAHQLKGSGGGYGYPILTQKALELETNATANELDVCLDLLADLKALCARVTPDPAT